MKKPLAALIALFIVSLSIGSARATDFRASPFGEASVTTTEDENTTTLQFTCPVLASGSYTMHLSLPAEISFAQGQPTDITASADSGSTIVGTWTIVPSVDGVFMMEVGLEATIPGDESGRFAQSHSIPCYIQVDNGQAVYGSEEIPPQFSATLEDTMSSVGQQGAAYNISVNVSGRVFYKWLKLCFHDDYERGIPGLTVYLDWDNDDKPNTRSTPYCTQFPFVCFQQGRDYDITDMNGAFSFNFSFGSSIPANQIASKIRIWVQRGNAGGKIHDEGTSYFIPHAEVNIAQATTSIVASNRDVWVDVNNGAVLRGLYRARQFYRLELGAPSVGQIEYKYESGGISRTHHDLNDLYIIFTSLPEPEVAYHEYGHCVDYLNGGEREDNYDGEHERFKVTDFGTAWKEGWAEFYSAATVDYWQALEPQNGVEFEGEGSPSYVYNDFMDQNGFASGIDALTVSTRPKVEGCVAAYLYSLYDSYAERANGYVGDNEDMRIPPPQILAAFTEAEQLAAANTLLLPFLNDQVKSLGSAPTAQSVQAIYDYTFLGQQGPRSPTPKEVTASVDGAGTTLDWVDNTVADEITVGATTGCPYSFDIYARNEPDKFRIYSRLNPPSEWNYTLSGYTFVDEAAYPAHTELVATTLTAPVSYVVVAENQWGVSRPQAEFKVVLPIYLEFPADSNPLNGIVNLAGTINSRTAVSGVAVTAEFDSLSLEWSVDSDPLTWHRYGLGNVATGAVNHGTLGTWDTGVVPTGDYVIQVTAHYGAVHYWARKAVSVQHRSTTVAASGAAYTSISDAMNWALPGDEILVSAGVYPNTSAHPTINLKQSVRVSAVGGVVELKPYGNNPIISVSGHEFPATLTGLTLRRDVPSTSATSYGVNVDGSPVRFRSCYFQNLQASSGAAIMATGAARLALDDCHFVDTQQYQSFAGGVLALVATSNGKPSGDIISCFFVGNEVPPCVVSYLSSSPLQGLEPKPRFTNCHFDHNNCCDALVKLSNTSRTVEFVSCYFTDNTLIACTGSAGSAVYCDNAKVQLDNCTIANNDGSGTDAGAVGIGSSGTSPVTIDDSIIAFNDGAVVNKTNSGMPSNVTLARCIVFSNTAGSYRTDTQWATSGTNVYEENPAFYDALGGNYSLYCFSPAAPGLNGESGLHFSELVGAFDPAHVQDATHVPLATVTVSAGQLQNGVLLGCPGGETTYQAGTMDHLTITVNLDDNVMTRTISGPEVSILPPYLSTGIASTTKIRGSAQSQGNGGNGYTLTLANPCLSGAGSDQATICLDGYPLAQTATISRRTPDYKSAGSPGPAPCAGDNLCSDGKVTNADWGWFVTHYPTGANPNATYLAAADYVAPFGSPITLGDLTWFSGHFTALHKLSSTDSPLLVTGDPEMTATTHVAFGFSEEYVTALQHRLYVDVTLEDCAEKNWCAFAIKTNRSDLSLSSWQPTSWAATSAPFVPIDAEDGQLLFFGVIMINDTEESSRQLGRLAFEVQGSDPITIGTNQFVLTMGELEVANNPDGEAFVISGEPVFQHMSGVAVRQLNATVQQVFHNSLTQNFPNPFNPQTTLAYSLHDASDVTLVIYDVGGHRIRDLVNEHRPAGAYKVVWDGTDTKGSKVASGVYFYKLVAGSFTETKKMIMLK